MTEQNHTPDPLDVAVGQRIRVRRKAVGVSQSTLAEFIGVSFQQCQKYEKGSNRVSASMLIRIAHRLDTTVAALVGEDETIKAAPDELSAFICSPAGLRLAEAAKALPANAQASLINVARAMGDGFSGARA
jgi:transcriptional regulator with XRE-family HTH domain